MIPKFISFATIDIYLGHCPEEWLEFEGRCYKFFGGGEITGSEYVSLNWTDASLACKNNSITR